MSVQAKPSQLYKPEDGTSCRRYILAIDHDIKAVSEPRFFDILMSNLLPGDEITVKQFDKVADGMSKARLLARQDFEVVALDHANRRVEIAVCGEVVAYAAPQETTAVTVKWNPGKKKHQVIADDEVLFESDEKSEAQDFLNRHAA